MFDALAARAELPADSSLAQVVDAVRAMPLGRPTVATIEGTLSEWCGTAFTKHALLAAVIARRWPDARPRLVHRVYLCTPDMARQRYGDKAAALVPADGLWDVHRYLTVELDGRRVTLDVTLPSAPAWDGVSSMPVAAGPGSDHEAGQDPDRELRVLEAAHCDPAVRGPFVAALSADLASA